MSYQTNKLEITPPYFIKDNNQTQPKSKCLHDNCKSCNGTGIKVTGGICIHNLYCSCPKCSIR